MIDKQLQYVIPAGTRISAFKSRLKEAVSLQEDPGETLDRTYLDSFDWRVYGHGSVLEMDSVDGQFRLLWRALGSEAIYGSQRVDGRPRFVWDLPDSPLRARLEPVLEMRALIPQARIRSRVHPMRWLNSDGKTVLKLAVEDNQLLYPGGKKTRRLGHRLRVIPVRGYDRPLKRMLKLLEADMALAPTLGDSLVSALAELGIQPGTYTSKLNIHLDPGMRADAAARQVLLTLLDAMEANAAGTREDLDSEFLHDFRVAVRRTRSALGQIKGVLPQRVLERFQPDFAWLGQITGPTRDMDVYLLKFDDYRGSLPASARGDLVPLHDFLIAHQKTEQRALVKQIGTARYRKLVKDWRGFLESPLPQRSSLPNAARPILDVANERTWRMYRRALKEGRAIGTDSPAEALHELRKTCKKLRYLMEFFQSLYPPKRIKALIKALKVLQDNLGDFQDLEVQGTNLRHFSEQMVAEGNVPAPTLMAMGILVDGLARRQHAAREEFAARFAHFSAAENQQQFRELFASAPEPVAA